MKILVLGGTVFIGRHIVESALIRGHTVSVFNRGRENRELFPDIEKLRGDRHSDLEALKGKNWDVVIDASGYMPKAVRLSSETLVNSVERYIYISTQSVYQEISHRELDETFPTRQLSQEELAAAENLSVGDFPTGYSYEAYYGGLKAECEKEVRDVLTNRVMVVRPGVVVGPHDYTNRLAYWISRISKGGEVLCPNHPQIPVRYIDVRDLAEWIILSAENRSTGVYNTLGPTELTFGELLSTCKTIANSDAKLTWINEKELLERNVQHWTDLPLWLSSNLEGFFFSKDKRAIHKGMQYRSVDQTVKDTFDWLKETDSHFRISQGLSAEREDELLKSIACKEP